MGTCASFSAFLSSAVLPSFFLDLAGLDSVDLELLGVGTPFEARAVELDVILIFGFLTESDRWGTCVVTG